MNRRRSEGRAGAGSGFYSRRGTRRRGKPGSEDRGGEEVKELRRRLRRALYERPQDIRTLVRSVEGLTRAAAAEQRISPAGREQLAASIEAVYKQLEEQIAPWRA